MKPPQVIDPETRIRVMLRRFGDQEPPDQIVQLLLHSPGILFAYLDRMAMIVASTERVLEFDGAVPVFVELCAGLASVSLMLQVGRYARPPVSRMGNKHGYALAILRVMGLRPGQGADRYLWCEPDPGCRALLHAYTDRAVMQEAAAIIRGWADEDPRALWERLRAEGPVRVGEAREVARFVQVKNRTTHAGDGYKSPEHGDGNHEATDGVYRRTAAATYVLPATIHTDARTVEPIPGAVVYIDFPYLGDGSKPLTGYGHTLTLEDQVDLATRWSDAGAAVYVSECVSRVADFGAGWWDVDITSQRTGQRRTFSTEAGRQEWVTCNREPAWRPAEQQGLFG